MKLFERIESSPASRELDVLIALAVGWDVGYGSAPFNTLVEKFGMKWAVETSTDQNSIYSSLPQYTTSFDAAMSLVDKDKWRYGFSKSPDAEAEAFLQNPDDHNEKFKGVGETPELALCAVAMRAHHPKPLDAFDQFVEYLGQYEYGQKLSEEQSEEIIAMMKAHDGKTELQLGMLKQCLSGKNLKFADEDAISALSRQVFGGLFKGIAAPVGFV